MGVAGNSCAHIRFRRLFQRLEEDNYALLPRKATAMNGSILWAMALTACQNMQESCFLPDFLAILFTV